jgi:hypothetical protein
VSVKDGTWPDVVVAVTFSIKTVPGLTEATQEEDFTVVLLPQDERTAPQPQMTASASKTYLLFQPSVVRSRINTSMSAKTVQTVQIDHGLIVTGESFIPPATTQEGSCTVAAIV